jgi:hypothetical protein
MRIKDEIRWLYKKKQQLNDTMYKIHLKAAQEWGSMWTIILESITESTNGEIERKYSNIDKEINTLSKAQTRNNETKKSFYLRVDNRTKISFSGNELTLLNNGLKYNLNYKPKNWIKNVALEAETAIMHLPYNEQEGMRYMVARNIQALSKQRGSNKEHNTDKGTSDKHIIHTINNKLQSNNHYN